MPTFSFIDVGEIILVIHKSETLNWSFN